jgi:hypothetical protein
MIMTYQTSLIMSVRNVSQAMKKKVAAEQSWKCNNCQIMLDETYEVDHIVPLFRAGVNLRRNLQALCPGCHATKTYNERITPERSTNVRVCLNCHVVYSPYFTHECQQTQQTQQPQQPVKPRTTKPQNVIVWP